MRKPFSGLNFQEISRHLNAIISESTDRKNCANFNLNLGYDFSEAQKQKKLIKNVIKILITLFCGI